MGLSNNLGKLSNMITSTGSAVGIAQPSPAYTLDVTGTGRFTTALTIGSTESTWNLASSNKLQIQNSMLVGYSTTGTFLGMNLTYNSAAWKYISTGYASLYSQDSGAHTFFTTDSGTAAATATINAKLTITNAGNVGIGTSSPTALSGFTSVCANNVTTGAFFEAQQNGTVLTRFGGQSDIAFIDTVANIPFIIKTNSTERVRISATGVVTLVGTNAQLLQQTTNSIAGDNAAVFYNSNANSYGMYIGAGSGTNHALYITDSTRTANLFKVQGDGKVGIGTATPPFRLTVAQDITNDTGDINVGQFMVCGATTNNKRLVIGYDTNGNGYGYIESAYYNSTWTYTCLQPTAGNVMVGTATDLGYKLGVNGSAAKPGGGSWSDSSDARLKKDIKTIENALDKINKLNPVNFEWINPEEHHNQSNVSGFIAQEMKEVFPDFINEANPIGKDKDIVGENEKIYALTLSFKFDAYLVKSIQELSAQNQDLKSRLDKAGL